MPTEYPGDQRGRKAANDFKSMMWSIPAAIAAVVLVAAILIFSSGGPDRTRTADFNAPNSVPSQTEKRQLESGIPPSGGATGTPAPAQPQKSNPAGTQ